MEDNILTIGQLGSRKIFIHPEARDLTIELKSEVKKKKGKLETFLLIVFGVSLFVTAILFIILLLRKLGFHIWFI